MVIAKLFLKNLFNINQSGVLKLFEVRTHPSSIASQRYGYYNIDYYKIGVSCFDGRAGFFKDNSSKEIAKHIIGFESEYPRK